MFKIYMSLFLVLFTVSFQVMASSPPVKLTAEDYIMAYKIFPSIGNLKEAKRTVIEKKYAKGLGISEKLSFRFHNMPDPRKNNKLGYIDQYNLYVDSKNRYELPYWTMCKRVLSKINFNPEYEKKVSLDEKKKYITLFRKTIKKQSPEFQCALGFIIWSKQLNLKVNKKRFISTVKFINMNMRNVEKIVNTKLITSQLSSVAK